MMDSSYDPEADTVYITVGKGTFAQTLEAAPFVYDVDAEGRALGVEISSASMALADGDSEKAGLPNGSRNVAAERPKAPRAASLRIAGRKPGLMAQHLENDAIDDWIEANCDLEGCVTATSR
ncbi:MAG: DUF2283 domain-containing protein [Rhodopseudomonas palustris]|nr:DUF2283 domain-containing protein [Rhodopseudomonas palustris]